MEDIREEMRNLGACIGDQGLTFSFNYEDQRSCFHRDLKRPITSLRNV